MECRNQNIESVYIGEMVKNAYTRGRQHMQGLKAKVRTMRSTNTGKTSMKNLPKILPDASITSKLGWKNRIKIQLHDKLMKW